MCIFLKKWPRRFAHSLLVLLSRITIAQSKQSTEKELTKTEYKSGMKKRCSELIKGFVIRALPAC